MSQKIELEVVLDSSGAIESVKGVSAEVQKFGNKTDDTTGKLQKQKKAVDDNTFSLKGLAVAAASLFAAWKIKEFFSDSIGEAMNADKAYSMLQKTLDLTGGAYGKTVDQIKEFTSQMMWTTGVEDETTAAVMRQLIQMRLSPEILERVTKSVINFNKSTGDGVVTQQGAIDTAKKFALALEHPDVALRGLRDAGIVFSTSQRKVINEMIATGDTAKVQEAILRNLESRYSSTEPDNYALKVKKIGLAFGEIQESLGTGLLEGIQSSGLFDSLFGDLQSGEIEGNFQKLGEVIGKSFGEIAKVITENMKGIIEGLRFTVGLVSDIASGFVTVITPVKNFASWITESVGGVKNLAIAAGTFFTVWKIGSLVSGIVIFNTALTAATLQTTLMAAATNAMTASIGFAHAAWIGLKAVLPFAALAALAAEILYVNSLLDDLKDSYENEIDAIQRNIEITNLSIIKYRSFRDEIGLTSQQLSRMTRDFSNIEDVGIRTQKILQAIRDGKYGKELADDFKQWDEQWQKTHRTAQQVRKEQVDIDAEVEARKAAAIAAIAAHTKQIEAEVVAMEKSLGISEKAGKSLIDQSFMILKVYENNKGVISSSIEVNQKFQTEVDKLTAAYTRQGQIVTPELKKIKSDVEEWEKKQRAVAAALTFTIGPATGLTEKLFQLSGMTATVSKEEEELTGIYLDLRREIGMLTATDLVNLETRLNAVASVWVENWDTIGENITQTENMRGIVEKLVETYRIGGIEIPENLQYINENLVEFKKNQDAIYAASLMSTGGLEGMSRAFSFLGLSTSDANTETKDFSSQIQALAETTGQAIDALEKMKIISSGLAGILKGFSGGLGSVASGLNSIKTAGSDMIGTLSKISGVIGIISGAASILSSIISVLSGKSGELKAVERDLNGLSGLTKNWSKQLEQAAKDIGGAGSAGRALNAALDDMIRLSEIVEGNFGDWVEQIRNIFSTFTQGFAGAKETAENFGSAFTSILREAKRLGLEGGKDMTGLLLLFEEMRKKGVLVSEILEYINSETEKGVSGYRDMIGALDATELQKKIDDLRSQIAFTPSDDTSFDRGQAILDLAALNDQMNSLEKIQGVFSSAVIDTYDGILSYQKKLADNPILADAIKGWSTAMISFSNTNRLTLDQFAGYSQTVKNEFDALKDVDFSDAEALNTIKDQLQRLYMLSKQYPDQFQLDPVTQGLIDQAIALGYVTEQQGKVLTDQEIMRTGYGLLLDGVYLLVETLGGTVPDAMRQASASFAGLGDDMNAAVSDVNPSISVGLDTSSVDLSTSLMQDKMKTLDDVTLNTTNSMNSNFMTVQGTVDSLAKSVIDLELRMKGLDGIDVFGVKEEKVSRLAVEKQGSRSVIPVQSSASLDIRMKVENQSGSVSDSVVRDLVSAIKQGMKGGIPSDFDLATTLKRMIENNTGGFIDKLKKVI